MTQPFSTSSAIDRLQHAATEIETTAYDLVGIVEKSTIARLILIAAELEKIVESVTEETGSSAGDLSGEGEAS